ncbi:hypothetical protein BN1723_020669, partial [Verticillium longisporum]
DADQGRAQEEA